MSNSTSLRLTSRSQSSQPPQQTRVFVLLGLISILGSSQVYQTLCDLQQAGDAKIDLSLRSSELAHDENEDETHNQNNRLSDPEYVKRELKEVIRRQVDSDKDGRVSYEELKKYLSDLHDKTTEFNIDKQWRVYSPQIHEVFSWEGYEPERREVLTWDHYFNQTYPELVGVDVGIPIIREQDSSRILNSPAEEAKGDKSSAKSAKSEDEDSHMKQLKLMVARADARWKLADENGDTLLTKQEFKFLLHPDEGCEELQNLFVREATEDMDLDKDGKICLEEFMKHLQVLASDVERNDKAWLSSQQENFGMYLDKNKDGVLDGDEIKNWLVPPKGRKFESEAKRLLDVGDMNGDFGLSTAEILDHPDQFASLLPEFWQHATPSPPLEAQAAGGQTDDHTESREEL